MSAPGALRLLAREPEDLRILTGVDTLERSPLVDVDAKLGIPSPDGARIAVVQTGRVDIYATASATKVGTLPVPEVMFAEWSPTGAYITTAKRGVKGPDNVPLPNVQVWDVAEEDVVVQLARKGITKESWPIVRWTGDDSTCFYAVTNTVHAFSRPDNFSSAKKIPIKGLVAFAPCPVKPLLAAFVPEAKGQPAVATIVDYSGAEPVTVSRKSFYRSNACTMYWSSSGAACLCLATADTDATNQSYYGEAKLHYLPADPAHADGACAVELPKEGPVHDVAWSPAGDYFCVVAGFMPAKVMLFDARCKPVFDLGSGPYNSLFWNPFGRFLAVAGFGNLPGDIVFWKKENKGVCKQMAATRAPAVKAAWSPCGRYLMTAIVAPRLRVDNNVRVFDYVGTKVGERKFDTLYDACWIPAAPGVFEDRPPSPGRLSSVAGGAPLPASMGGGLSGHLARGAAAQASEGNGGAAKAAYRPPAMRSGAGSGAATPTFSMAYDPNSKPGRILDNSGKPQTVGAQVTKAAAKNAKKRAAKKKAAGGGGQGGEEEEQEEEEPSTSAAAQAAQQPQQQQQQAAAVAAAAEGVGSVNLAEGPEAIQKKLRALQKKLRQIQQLKERRDKEGPQALEPEQLQKIGQEAGVAAEIRSLGGDA